MRSPSDRSPSSNSTTSRDPRGVHILARSLVKQMREQGYGDEQIINLSSELLTLVNDRLKALEPAE